MRRMKRGMTVAILVLAAGAAGAQAAASGDLPTRLHFSISSQPEQDGSTMNAGLSYDWSPRLSSSVYLSAS
ncbi:MAG: hypothetical protein ACOYM2_02490 [Rectinemataceae bacterium]